MGGWKSLRSNAGYERSIDGRNIERAIETSILEQRPGDTGLSCRFQDIASDAMTSSNPALVAALARRSLIDVEELQRNVDTVQRGPERRRVSSRFTERAFGVDTLDRRPIL